MRPAALELRFPYRNEELLADHKEGYVNMAMKRRRKPGPRNIIIREMGVDDIPAVYRLGRRLFQAQEASTFYRTWDAYEVTHNYNQDPGLTLVAQTRKGTIAGFALGTTYGDESGGWKYGYILWMGVSPRQQGSGLGSQLYREMERRMREEGVRMAFVDTARSNSGAIKFFKRMGYGKPEAEVWMSKILQRTRRGRNDAKTTPPPRKRRLTNRRMKSRSPRTAAK